MKNKVKEEVSLFNKLKWFFYDLGVRIFHSHKKSNTIIKPSSIKRNQTIFLFFFLLLPTIQFIIFYFGVNFNSILLAFQKAPEGVLTFAGFENFSTVLADIFANGKLFISIKNSFIQFVIGMFIGTPLHVTVAYAIFKKIPFSGFFKIMLFMPSMISSMVFVLCGQYLINYGFPQIFGNPDLFLLDRYADSGFWTVLVFAFWHGFAGGLIVYLGAMSSISVDVIEYGKLEPLSSMRELWSIVIPLIFPTITTYIVVGLAGFFTNQGMYFSFFGAATGPMKYDTLGYVFFTKIASSEATIADYPYAAAGGLLFTLIVAPVTITTKSLLEKYGPSEE